MITYLFSSLTKKAEGCLTVEVIDVILLQSNCPLQTMHLASKATEGELKKLIPCAIHSIL